MKLPPRPCLAASLFLVAASLVAAQEAPTVAVAPVERRDLSQEVTIQAEFRPYQEVELHAMVAGYLHGISVDFGDRVRAGEVIATLEVPELGDELARAQAVLDRAKASHEDAHLNNVRLKGVNESQPNLVAQQDLDTAEALDRTTAAEVDSAGADVSKYRTLLEYTRIRAPFDGVVTARYADPGALVQTGTSSDTQSLPLVRISENQRLRLDFPVSVSYVDSVAVGDPVEIRMEGSGRVLTAPVIRFSRRVDRSTRTMETEVEVPNDDLKIVPGMYATVTLRIRNRPGALAIPLEALSGSSSPTAYVVSAGGVIAERSLKLGLETPAYTEVLSGLDEGDLVVVGSRSDLHPGETVRAQTVGEAP